MKGMVDRNPHTGAKLQSRLPSEEFSNNYDYVFKPKLTKVKPGEYDTLSFPQYKKHHSLGWLGINETHVYGIEFEGFSQLEATPGNIDNPPGWADCVYILSNH